MAKDRQGNWLAVDGLTPMWKELLRLARGIADTPHHVLEHRSDLKEQHEKQEQVFSGSVNSVLDQLFAIDGIRLEQGDPQSDGSWILSICVQINGDWYEVMAERCSPRSCHTIGALGLRRLVSGRNAKLSEPHRDFMEV